eukprot:GSChrysophyteH1.ASY1.ANO1.2277.1 assembled CDS
MSSYKLTLPSGEVFWESNAENAPSVGFVKEHFVRRFYGPESSLSTPDRKELLTHMAVEVIRHAPAKFVGILLTNLICSFWLDGGVRELYALKSLNESPICGAVFKVGEIVWTCRQCAKDVTCVQCNSCFKQSDHEGHEVYFHRATASGGCCDCGDPEAWAVGGNCSKHTGEISDLDPSSLLPKDLEMGVIAVLQGCLGVAISYSISLSRAYDCTTRNVFLEHFHHYSALVSELSADGVVAPEEHELDENGLSPQQRLLNALKGTKEKFCVTVHNDDIHTYQDVTRHLREHCTMNLSDAEVATKKVDSDGLTTVCENDIDGAGAEQEQVSMLVFGKVQYLHSRAAALQRPVGEDGYGLLTSIEPKRLLELEPRVSAFILWMQELGKRNDGIRRVITDLLMRDITDLPENAVALTGCTGVCKPNEIFKDSLRFPSVLPSIPHLRKLPKGTSEWNSLVFEPFNGNCPKNTLGVLLLSSPLLTKSVKTALSSFVVIYQQDLKFKACFSQMLTILYPSLYAFYGRYVGTRQDEIFSTTVQVYTANRVVTMMSSDGVDMRPLPEPKDPVKITLLLAQTLYYAIQDMGCPMLDDSSSHGAFLKHHGLRSHRHQQLFRDIEYVTENVVGNLNLICGTRDVGTIEVWIQICLSIQNMCALKRYVDAHIETEDSMWHTSTNLTLEMESASTNIISNALFPSEEILAAESQAFSGGTGDLEETPKLASDGTSRMRSGSIADLFDLRASQQLGTEKLVSKVVELGITEWANSNKGKDKMSIRKECTAQMYPLLGHHVVIPEGYAFKSYDVASNPVSVNNPVHRLLAKIFVYAAYNNLDLEPALNCVRNASVESKICIGDFPLRTHVLCVQIAAKMWRRNGAAPSNLSYNYNRGPINKSLKMMDIACMQLCVLSFGPQVGPDMMLLLAIDRCGMEYLLEDDKIFDFNRKSMDPLNLWKMRNAEYQGPLLSGFLKILINIVASLPTCLLAPTQSHHPGTRYADSVETALAREITNSITSGANTLGQLQSVKLMVGGDKTVLDSTVNKVVDQLCSRHDAFEEGGMSHLELLPESYRYFDPEYSHSTQEQLNNSVDFIRDRLKKQIKNGAASKDRPVPIIMADALPDAHKSFEEVRGLLFRPLMHALIKRSVELATAKAQHLGPSGRVVAERVVYLLTLRVHFAERYRAAGTSTDVHELKTLDHEPLLDACVRLWNSDTFSEDELYRLGLAWVLQRMIAMGDPGVRDYFASHGIKFAFQSEGASSGQIETPESTEKARLVKMKAAAQQKAMAMMQKASASFAMEMEGWSSCDDESDEEAEAKAAVVGGSTQSDSSMCIDKAAAGDETTEEGRSRANSSAVVDDSTCIICHKSSLEHNVSSSEKEPVMGLLCFMQSSSNLKNIVSANAISKESVVENTFRVVSVNGCFVYSSVICESPLQPLNASKVTGRLGFGTHVLATRRVGRWVYIASPIVGWVEVYTERMRFPSETLHTHDTTFSNSTTSPATRHVVLVRNLVPITDFVFSKHGSSRLHASTCGHCMHFDCWNEFFANTVSAETSGSYVQDPPLAFDVLEGEFTCPLCKSVSNAFLPLTTAASAPAYWEQATENDSVVEGHFVSELDDALLSRWTASVKTGKAASPLRFSIIQLLDTPNVKFWGDGSASERLLDSAVTQYSQSWRRSDEKDIVPLSDPYDAKEVRVTKGSHIIWSTIAYTLQSNYNAARWIASSEKSGITNSPALSESNVYFVAQMLQMLRQMPNWFDNVGSFAECIGFPLKHLVSGSRISIADDDDMIQSTPPTNHASSSSAMPPTPPESMKNYSTSKIRPVKDLTMTECREALLSTPFSPLGDAKFPSPRRLSLIQGILRDKGIAPSELWGILSVPMLEQEITGIAVLSVCCSADSRSAETSIAIMCFARLCQILIEPLHTGKISDENRKATAALRGASGVGEGSQSPESKKMRCESTKEYIGIKCKDSRNDKDGICNLLKSLQDTITTAAGLKGQLSELDEAIPFRHKVLDSWVPFLEYAICLKAVFRCASTGSMESVPNMSSFSLEDLLHKAGLPSSLEQLLTDQVMSMLASRWGDQLGFIRKSFGMTEEPVTWLIPPTNANPFDLQQIYDRISSTTGDDKSDAGNSEKAESKSGEAVEMSVLDQHYKTCTYGDASDLINAVVQQIQDLNVEEVDQSEKTESPTLETAIGSRKRKNRKTMLESLPKLLGASYENAAEISSDYEELLLGIRSELIKASSSETEHALITRGLTGKVVFATKDNAARLFGRPLLEDYVDSDASPSDSSTVHAPNAFSVSDFDPIPGDSTSSDSTERVLCEPLKTWKLIGIDPEYRLVDGGNHPHETVIGLNADKLEYLHTRAPFVSAIHGQDASCDISGRPLCSGFADVSHLPLSRSYTGSLKPLPQVYTDMMDGIELPYIPKLDEQGRREDNPAMCLICGMILNGGNRSQEMPQYLNNTFLKAHPGECTLHTRSCGSGVGIFLLVLQNMVLLQRGFRTVKYGALYLDKNGEAGEGRGQNRPLVLSVPRFQKLEEMYLRHQVATEVTRKLGYQDRSIRAYYY